MRKHKFKMSNSTSCNPFLNDAFLDEDLPHISRMFSRLYTSYEASTLLLKILRKDSNKHIHDV
jgi:hypothetical protein